MTGFHEVLSQMVCLVTWLQEICKMAQMISNLQQFFEAFLRTLHEAIEGLNGHYEPNRASTILDRLHDFEITLGLISSRLASRGFSVQFLEDKNELTRALRFLHASYLSRHNDLLTNQHNSIIKVTGQTRLPLVAKSIKSLWNSFPK